MIYELKIELFNDRHPAHRIIQVDPSISLKQVHYIIQAAFDWSALMPHLFINHHSKGIQAFGEHKYLRHSFLDFYRKWQIRDENKQTLSSCLQEVGDSLIYEYYQNFKTTRYHSIELMAIKKAQKNRIYPYCLSAYSLNGREPFSTRFSRVDLDLNSDNINQLPYIINQFLLAEETIRSETLIEKEHYYLQLLFKHSLDFLIKKPWKNIAPDQIFVVHDPLSKKQLFCSIQGQEQAEPALNIFVGEDSFIELSQTIHYYKGIKQAEDLVDYLYHFYGLALLFKAKHQGAKLSISDQWDLSEQWAQWSTDYLTDSLPHLFSYKSDEKLLRQPSVEEMRWMILCLQQTFEVDTLIDKGLQLPSVIDSNILLERSFSYRFQQFINNEIRLIKK